MKSWSRNWPHDMNIMVRNCPDDRHLSALWMTLLMWRALGNASPVTLLMRGVLTPGEKERQCIQRMLDYVPIIRTLNYTKIDTRSNSMYSWYKKDSKNCSKHSSFIDFFQPLGYVMNMYIRTRRPCSCEYRFTLQKFQIYRRDKPAGGSGAVG